MYSATNVDTTETKKEKLGIKPFITEYYNVTSKIGISETFTLDGKMSDFI